MLKQICNLTKLTLLLLFFVQEHAQARFFHDDALEVDDESALGTGFYNDEISFRPPLVYERQWNSHPVGVLFNAGSYNKRRLMYIERLKFNTSSERPLTFSYKLDRYHSLLGNYPDREARLQFNSLQPFHLAAMLDSDSDKKWGDGGLAVTIMPQGDRSLEFYYWSVDHYYNSKKTSANDTYAKETKTYGLKYAWKFSEDLSLRYRNEIDTPLKWNHLSEGYVYENERQWHYLQADYGSLNSGWLWRATLDHEQKREAKEWVNDGESLRKKSMTRTARSYELLTNYNVPDHSDFTTGVFYIDRSANYDWEKRSDDDFNKDDEQKTPDIKRREPGLYSTYYHRPFGEARSHALQHGLYINYVTIRTDEVEYKTEVKWQFAWDYSLDTNANLTVNTTWNIDDLVNNFPYQNSDRPFLPWDGGNLQLQAVF